MIWMASCGKRVVTRECSAIAVDLAAPQVLRPETLAELSVDTLQGTNLQHGLMLARRFLAHHRDAEPVVLIVTDGEPTAHLEDDGTPFF